MISARDGGPAGPPLPQAAWAQLAADAPDGLAAVDSEGRIAWLNRAGERLFGRAGEDLIGARAPFALTADGADEPAGLFDDRSTEQVTVWADGSGARREFAYRARRLSGGPLTAVAFRDVTDERHRQRRIAAIARTAAKLASLGSLTAILDALAAEVAQADALAGVQILTLDDAGRGLRMMGSAGFRHWPDFFDRLIECHRRGAALRMLDALEHSEPVVVSNRWALVRDDPAWQPLHGYLGELTWESFASVRLMIRGRAAGVLNAFFAPGQVIGQRELEFLGAMAEQAAIAVDYAAMVQRERDTARREERRRLARDLHDSIVQQVFSMGMQAKSLELLSRRDDLIAAAAVRQIADEVGGLSRAVLADLRALIHELRPVSSAGMGGLGEAIRALADSNANRTALRFTLATGAGLERVEGEMAEDVYRIIAEAIHNVVKHAAAGSVVIRLGAGADQLTATVADDGRGIAAAGADGADGAGADGADGAGGAGAGGAGADGAARDPGAGYGLRMMRERAERWGGTLTVRPGRNSGTVVRLVMPLATGIPLAAS